MLRSVYRCKSTARGMPGKNRSRRIVPAASAGWRSSTLLLLFPLLALVDLLADLVDRVDALGRGRVVDRLAGLLAEPGAGVLEALLAAGVFVALRLLEGFLQLRE